MEGLKYSDKQRANKMSIIRGGFAAVLFVTGAAGCDLSPKPSSANTPTETGSPKASQLEDLAISQIDAEFNIILEYDTVALKEHLFVDNPGAKAALEKSLASFPSDFYSASNGGRLKIVIYEKVSNTRIYFNSSDVNTVYLPAQDLTQPDIPGLTSAMNLDLAEGFAQRKDCLSGNKTTDEIIQLLGGEQFVSNPASLYPRFEQRGIVETEDPADIAFPKKADGSIDTSRLVGVLASYYILGDEAEFFQIFGDIVSPGVAMEDANYQASKAHQLYLVLKQLFSGREYDSLQ
jgi:hypothetical protein